MDPTFTMGEFNKAMTSFQDCRGVVLDLRGNGGGIGGMAPGLAGWFVQENNQSLGEMMTRDSHVNLLVRPRLNAYRGPLAVLVDGLSASTSEFLAAGLQIPMLFAFCLFFFVYQAYRAFGAAFGQSSFGSAVFGLFSEPE